MTAVDLGPRFLKLRRPRADAALILGTLAADGLALTVAVRYSLGAGLLLHGLLAAGTGWSIWRLHRAGGDSRLGALLAITLPWLGPFAAVGMLLCLVTCVVSGKSVLPFDEWFAELSPEHDDHDEAFLKGVSALQRDAAEKTGVTSLIDLLQFGDFVQKQKVVTLVAREYRPEFAPVLARALTDASNAVRVQAATAITAIEERFVRKTTELTARSRRAPDDVDRLLALARHYDDYAFSGILDPIRERENRDRALEQYRQVIARRPDDGATHVAACRIMIRQGRYFDAMPFLAAALIHDDKNPSLLAWYFECLYLTGEFTALRAAIAFDGATVMDWPLLPLRLCDALRMWAPPHEVAA
jgi:hypothetical protein